MTKEILKPKNHNNPYLKSYVQAVKKGFDTQHVIPHAKGWAVKKITAKKVSAVFNNKKMAIFKARKIAKNQNSEVIIYNKHGRIAEKISYQ